MATCKCTCFIRPHDIACELRHCPHAQKQDDQKIIEEGLERLSREGGDKKCNRYNCPCNTGLSNSCPSEPEDEKHEYTQSVKHDMNQSIPPQPPQDWEEVKDALEYHEHYYVRKCNRCVKCEKNVRTLLEKTREEALQKQSVDMQYDCQVVVEKLQKEAKQALLAKLRGEVEGMREDELSTRYDCTVKPNCDECSKSVPYSRKIADAKQKHTVKLLSDILKLIETL